MCHQSSSEELLFSSQKAYEGHWEYNDKYSAIPYHHFSFLSIKTGINICHYKISSIKKKYYCSRRTDEQHLIQMEIQVWLAKWMTPEQIHC